MVDCNQRLELIVSSSDRFQSFLFSMEGWMNNSIKIIEAQAIAIIRNC